MLHITNGIVCPYLFICSAGERVFIVIKIRCVQRKSPAIVIYVHTWLAVLCQPLPVNGCSMFLFSLVQARFESARLRRRPIWTRSWTVVTGGHYDRRRFRVLLTAPYFKLVCSDVFDVSRAVSFSRARPRCVSSVIVRRLQLSVPVCVVTC